MSILLTCQHVVLHGNDRELFSDLNITISSGDRIGVVGINGAGKSTLLRLVAGQLSPDAGTIHRVSGTRIGYLEQDPVFTAGTVRDVIGDSWESASALDRLGMTATLDQPAFSLSGGQTKRVALARVFAQTHDLLVLDEPTNHLDLEAIEWLEQQILAFAGAVVLVSHDRFLLDRVTTRILEIDRGTTYVHTGGYGDLLEAVARREDIAAAAEATRKNLARRELAWLRRGVKARSTKPQARIDAAERLLQGGPAAAARDGSLELSIVTPPLGKTAVTAHDVSFAYPDAAPTVAHVSLDIGPGDRIGLVGPNGAGKSTLLRLLTKQMRPSEGQVIHAGKVVFSHFDQHGADLDPDATVQQLVAGNDRPPGDPADLALMRRFWFTGALTGSRVRELSGGERRRLQLLLALAERPNVLFLDEPTNDLDLETLRTLEDFLADWPGTLVVVSHDRTFLSRTTDHLYEVRRDGTVHAVPGGIDGWVLRAQAPTPTSSLRVAADAPSSGASRAKQLRDLEKDLTRLERQKAKVLDKLAAATDHVEMTELGRTLAEIQKDLERTEEEWLLLSEA